MVALGVPHVGRLMSPLGSDEIAGLGFEQVVRLEMSPEQRTEVRLTVADEGRWRGEVIALRMDGAPIWVELRDHRLPRDPPRRQ